MAVDAIVGDLNHQERELSMPIVRHLLQVARTHGFSNEGEMFEASHLVNTALEIPFIRERLEVHEEEWDDPLQILRHLQERRVVLVPYDVSPNNEPANAKGHKAHWALIKGFCLSIDSNSLSGSSNADLLESHTSPIPNIVPHDHFVVSAKWTTDLSCVTPIVEDMLATGLVDPDRLLLIATQGRSKHVQLWSNALLWSSNHQLVDPSISRTSAQRWIIPPTLEGLCGKIVVLSRKRS